MRRIIALVWALCLVSPSVVWAAVPVTGTTAQSGGAAQASKTFEPYKGLTRKFQPYLGHSPYAKLALAVEPGRTSQGSASVTPDWGISGQFGTWKVRYVVGSQGIATGGGIAVELPKVWYAGPRMSAIPLQNFNPKGNDYLTASTSDPHAVIKTIVEGESHAILQKWDKPTLDGRTIRYVFVVRVIVEHGKLKPGDVITVVFGDKSKGSAGYQAPIISNPARPILMALDSNGDSHFKLLKNNKLPEITSLPGTVDRMWAYLPSQAVVGKPVTARVGLVDENANPIDHAAVLDIYVKTGKARFKRRVIVWPDKGYAQFKVIPLSAGVLRLRVRTADFAQQAISNPAVVTTAPRHVKLYWGDLCSHTNFSWDGVGVHDFYYARYITSLDFVNICDHTFPKMHGRARGLNKGVWPRYAALADKANDPHHFVAFLGYEDSMGPPWGHRVVVFRGNNGPVAYPQAPLPKLWAMLTKGDALTIPQHPGKMPVGIDFHIRNKYFQRNISIYDSHGSSEYYDPANPLAPEHILFTADGRSVPPSYHQYVQDAWEMGQKLSTVAESDNHHAHPGQPRYGLTAVYARTKTRNGIFKALYDRDTYATTGARIILHFDIDGTPMGHTLKVNGTPDIKIGVIGTGPLEWVELLRYQKGDKKFRVIRHWNVTGWSFNGQYHDNSFKPGAIYYCRVRQKYKVDRIVAEAWSSPIWTKK